MQIFISLLLTESMSHNAVSASAGQDRRMFLRRSLAALAVAAAGPLADYAASGSGAHAMDSFYGGPKTGMAADPNSLKEYNDFLDDIVFAAYLKDNEAPPREQRFIAREDRLERDFIYRWKINRMIRNLGRNASAFGQYQQL